VLPFGLAPVLYLYIYIALLAAYANQKHLQCERPKDKRTVLRERKEALGSQVNEVIVSKEGVGSEVQGQ